MHTSECSPSGELEGGRPQGDGSDLTGAGVWQREVSPVGGKFGEPSIRGARGVRGGGGGGVVLGAIVFLMKKSP